MVILIISLLAITFFVALVMVIHQEIKVSKKLKEPEDLDSHSIKISDIPLGNFQIILFESFVFLKDGTSRFTARTESLEEYMLLMKDYKLTDWMLIPTKRKGYICESLVEKNEFDSGKSFTKIFITQGEKKND